jgi:GNAT superfamily N-acetyltransferase
MNDKRNNSSETEVIIRELMRKDSRDLIDVGFPYPIRVLYPSLRDDFLQATRLKPREIGLVAYHTGKKRAVSFLSLVAHTHLLYSIRYVFADPNFRQMGIATRLLNEALIFAKRRGGKKFFLTAYPFGAAIRIYRKIGFRRIVNTSLVKGAGSPANFLNEYRNQLITLRTTSLENKDHLFSIYKRSMGQEWVDFFGNNAENLMNGYSKDYQHFFSKKAFINYSKESFALVFKRPFFHDAYVELYGLSDANFPSMLKALMDILHNQGINYVSITLFNITDQHCLSLLQEYNFYPYQAILMGKSL